MIMTRLNCNIRVALMTLVVVFASACSDSPTPTPDSNAPPVFLGVFSDAERTEVVRQLNVVNAAAVNKGLTVKPKSYYLIEVRAWDKTWLGNPGCENPGFIIPYEGTLYDQTDADKDTRVGFVALCTAGRFLPPNRLILAREAITSSQVVEFEAEHLIFYHANRNCYELTKEHTVDKPHPIFQWC